MIKSNTTQANPLVELDVSPFAVDLIVFGLDLLRQLVVVGRISRLIA